MKKRSYFMALLMWGLLSFVPVSAMATSLDWSTFKARFMAQDGRIIDTGNHNISHTEGQGFSMLFAVAANDKRSFDQIWHWTRKYLRDPKSGLFYWRYNPIAANPVADKNNASDGDVMIAWALLKAAHRWHVPQYLTESDTIVKAVLKYVVVDVANYKVMLPGRYGFENDTSVTLNPSYFIFPAWRDFERRTHLATISQLIDDSQRLMNNINWGTYRLPTDWISLSRTGTTSPASAWPARVSYDAIRVPLYTKWADRDNPVLMRWKQWFAHYPRAQMPAWENMVNHNKAPYSMNGGLLAIRDFTMDQLAYSSTKIVPKDDYYSSSLKLLTALADQGF